MNKTIQALTDFLDQSHSVYHAVANLAKELVDAGYVQLHESSRWELVPGGKYYITRGESAMIAFSVPKGTPKGFLMSATHSDRPCFKLKENAELAGTYTRLATEKYGGMLISTWMDRPLSVAGRVFVETPEGVKSRLIDIDADLLMMPNVAIHMNPKANEGYAWNPAVDTVALAGGKAAAGKINALIEKEAGGKVLGHDLYLYIRQKSCVWGVDQEYISSAALDDLECTWCCARGFMEADESQNIPVLCVFDSEEVGSGSVQGADASLLEDILTRICDSLSLDKYQMLGQSFMVSADNAHAVHPNHPEYADQNNAPTLNGGIVVKFNSNLSYCTDGAAAAIFRSICQEAKVPVQTFYNRADLRGGSTLGRISASHISVPTVDIGLAQLAMHSSYETAGVQDAEYLQKAMKAYFSCTLERPEDGCFILKK